MIVLEYWFMIGEGGMFVLIFLLISSMVRGSFFFFVTFNLFIK